MMSITVALLSGRRWPSEMLIFIAAIFLVAAGSVTIPSVSLLCVTAGIGSILLEILI